ncbi:glucose-1-phosphate adenylyltransferase [Granulosicoccus sp. 3-233]|uniref:glucose-1-phosphate adenylyltransferase n=1 Tax=Granulosicoccus sp. 3-233 TaxID=3417969 RepID=UPI003D34C4C6
MDTICEETICVLLAGGQGTRLYPLTSDRAKPSVPFGGKYRIIDFTLSNCLHSNIRRVLVLTQYKSHSLQKHLRDAWSIYSPELGEYITAVPPQMRTGESWYSGTADAIFQNLYLLERSGAKRVLILSGDHVYRMDYAAMLQQHIEQKADLSVACMRVPIAEASSFGIMTVDKSDRVIDFIEKPTQAAPLPDDDQHALASMGIYVFDIDVLRAQLDADHAARDSSHDFGHDLLPGLIATHRVAGYQFGGQGGRVSPDRYWRDVGTLDSYFEANMDLLSSVPPLDLYQDSWPIRTYQGQHPPARVTSSETGNIGSIRNCMLGNGSVVNGGTVIDSILSARVHVDEAAHVESSILFDGVQVGAGAILRRCIVDKDVRIPAGTRIGCDPTTDARRFHVSSKGVVAVPKDAFVTA